MSLSNRFAHPIERWMNHIVRRELDHMRRPWSSKSLGKGTGKTLSRISGDGPFSPTLAPYMSTRWAEPYLDLWEDPFFAEAPWVMNTPLTHLHSTSNVNEKGDLVLKTKMPYGITEDDIHLDYEEGGLKLHATKTHEESKKLHGSKGGSKHMTHVSISHYWPLGEGVTEKDVEAHFNGEDGILEITVAQPHQLERPRATPISIGAPRSHAMLDHEKTATEIVEEAKQPVSESMDHHAKPASAESITITNVKDSSKGTAKSSAQEAKQKKPLAGPDSPEVPSLDEM